MLYEIAKVESNLGTHPDTYKNKSNSLWQVDDIGLADTQLQTPKMIAAHKKIKNATGIDWMQVKPKDLDDPTLGAIAARLILLRKPGAIPNTEAERAVYWKKHYNKSGKGTVQKYLDRLK